VSSAGLFVIMAALINGKTDFNNPIFIKTKLACADISYTYTKEGQKYAGIFVDKKDYLTNYTNSDMLQQDIDKQCGYK
jgi:hypothetical protein